MEQYRLKFLDYNSIIESHFNQSQEYLLQIYNWEGLKSAPVLIKPNLQHRVEKEEERQNLHMIMEQLIEYLILEKMFTQEIMVKEKSGYQPRYFKNLVHNCSL